MKDLHCRDSGMDCDFVARGNTEDEVMRSAADHGKSAHQMSITDEVKTKIRSLIHDEDSDAHRRSMSSSRNRP